jgi:hypothetical protein
MTIHKKVVRYLKLSSLGKVLIKLRFLLRYRYFGDVGYLSRRLHRLHIYLKHGTQIRARQSVVANMSSIQLAKTIAEGLESRGYFITSIEALGCNPAVMEYCRELAKPVMNKTAEEVAAMNMGKSKTYWLDLYKDYEKPNPLLDFVTMPVLLEAAALYLREVPILSFISLYFTPPHTAHLMIGSQGWHLDNEAQRQMKIFLLPNPVDLDAGPSKLLPKQYSSASCYPNYPGYFTDSEMHNSCLPEKEIVEFTGSAGSVMLVDTSAVFHCGSLTTTHSRLQMIAAYRPMMSNLPYRDFKAFFSDITYTHTNAKIACFFDTKFATKDN